MSVDHAYFMQQALQLAELGRYSVSPNPMVGCVIVKDSQIVGRGYHLRAGEPHAEVFALQAAQNLAPGADLYVTLEPCCHHGLTPPCVSAIIQAGIRCVYIATVDPNPLVAGCGIQQLREHGISVITGIEEAAAKVLNEIFFHYITRQRPFVIAKWAMSLNGKTRAPLYSDRHITSESTQNHAHNLRAAVDAIIVGRQTVEQDDPRLTARIDGVIKQPLRIVVSSSGKLPLGLKLLDTGLAKTLIATIQAPEVLAEYYRGNEGLSLCQIPANNQNQVDLSALLTTLGAMQITSVLIEGGETLLSSFFAGNLVNKAVAYIAPMFISHDRKITMSPIDIQAISGDFQLTTYSID